MKAVLSDRIYLTVSPEYLKELEELLTYYFPSPNNPKQTVKYLDVKAYPNNIASIPIGRTDLIPLGYEVVDKRVLATTTIGDLHYTLRTYQQEAVDAIDDSYILKSYTGSGKSVMGTFIAKKLGQKTLIIVHTTMLRDQWVTEIERITGWRPDIIGSGKFGLSTPIVVGNIQTIRNKIPKIRKEFGTVILDEVQYVAATTFKNVMDKMSARYKIGMSATLRRKDGKDLLIQDYISKDIYEVPDIGKVSPKIIMEHISVKLDSNPMISWADKITKLYDNPNYLFKTVALVHEFQKQGRKILIVADRISFLEECADLTDNSILIHGRIEDRETKLDELNRDKSAVYGITSMFKEGMNYPIWDTLIITSQINNDPMLEQLVGRLTRPHPDNNELIVWDFWLAGSQANNQARNRRRFYTSKGYGITEIDNSNQI